MNAKRPLVVSFYAYKGGTGRSTALAHAASSLVRDGRRIVMLDLDLQAPSLWAFAGELTPGAGFVEYLRAWRDGAPVNATEMLKEVKLSPPAPGALYLMEAGKLDAAYLDTVQTLKWADVVKPVHPRMRSPRDLFDRASMFDELFEQLSAARPDAIFIDAPTGFNDTANLCLRVLSDIVIVIFTPTQVQLNGIARVLSLLTDEQLMREAHQQDPRPDVFAVASTILVPQVGGQFLRRLNDSFRYLEQTRQAAAAGRSERDISEQYQQDLAVISHDPLLAYSETPWSLTTAQRVEGAAFSDIVTYLQGALPEQVGREPRIRDKDRQLADLLPRLELFAERNQAANQPTTEQLFLRTRHVDEVQEDRVVLVLGGKGSGKTALYRYLAEGGATRGTAVRIHGSDSRGLSQDLMCRLQDAAPRSMDVVWRAYMLSRIERPVIDYPLLTRACEALRNLNDHPEGLRDIEAFLHDPDAAVGVDQAWKATDRSLAARSETLFLLLDGLDLAFKDDVERRERGITALFIAWQATFSTMERVRPKIFLRNDIWERLTFPERSNLLGREMKLTWDDKNLWRLLVKRALAAPAFAEWTREVVSTALNPASVETASERDVLPYLDRLFDRHIWAGKNSLSRNWMLRRLADAHGAIYPRDLVSLVREAVQVEMERVRERQAVSDAAVISRRSLADALSPTSRQRVHAVEEEYPELRQALAALSGLPSVGQPAQLLEHLREGGIQGPDAVLDRLRDAGVLKFEQDGNYRVPELYRLGTNMTRLGPR
jgi:cellulose biosynthesis protein BcsQ